MANPNIVSVSSILGGNAGFLLTNTLTTTLLTVAAEKLLKVNSIICANIHASNSGDLDLFIDGLANGGGTTGVTITDNSGAAPASTSVYLAKNVAVGSGSSLEVLDKPIYLMEGDILKGGASATSTLHLYLSYEVIDDA